MGLFKKKETGEEIPKLPELPRLPELPAFPRVREESEEQLPLLPSFPNSSLGEKFSQDTIKKAVTGRKRVEEVEPDEFAEEEMPMMQRPLVAEPRRREFYPQPVKKEEEPIFIRIDKFEEGSRTFEDVKKQVAEIERTLDDVKKVKEDEEKELMSWEEEIKQIKEKLEKIDNNIFSKIE